MAQPWPSALLSRSPGLRRSCRRISGWHYAVRGDPGRLCLEPSDDVGAIPAPQWGAVGLGGEVEVQWWTLMENGDWVVMECGILWDFMGKWNEWWWLIGISWSKMIFSQLAVTSYPWKYPACFSHDSAVFWIEINFAYGILWQMSGPVFEKKNSCDMWKNVENT